MGGGCAVGFSKFWFSPLHSAGWGALDSRLHLSATRESGSPGGLGVLVVFILMEGVLGSGEAGEAVKAGSRVLPALATSEHPTFVVSGNWT